MAEHRVSQSLINRLRSLRAIELFCLLALSQPLSAQVAPEVLAAQQARIDTIERISPAVVAIFAPGALGGGSGVLISPDGFAVTNFHVIEQMQGFMKCGLNDGRVYDAVIAGIDPTGDVAVVQLLGRDDFPHATIGDSDTVRVGDWTYAIGNPFLLADDLQPTVTYGMVSGVQRYQYPAGTFIEYTDCIQVDTSINPGNSGGPLFNERGELIGINGRISVAKRGRVNVGAGYAISINQVLNFLDHLKSGRVVDHATLGATVRTASDGSVLVAEILERSPAYQLGLRSGDEIVSFAGRPIRSVNQFKNILGIYPKGWQVPLTYQREGQLHEIQVRLMPLHRDVELNPSGGEEQRPAPQLPPELLEKLKPAAQVPEEFAHLFEERRGFVNYYFNRIAQERLLAQLAEWGDFSSDKGLWDLRFEPAVEVKLTAEAVAVRYLGNVFVQQLDEEWQDLPPGTGGLLAALQQFRQLLSEGPESFTEFYYVGSEPFPGETERVDVLFSSRGLVQSRWYFSRTGRGLLGFDTHLSEDRLPCEIRFDGQFEVPSGKLPRTWNIIHGGKPVQQLTLQAAQLGKSP
jgi:S1-C subfamily serine protease